MYRNKINNLVKEDKENLIEYLVTFDKTLLSNYKNDAEEQKDPILIDHNNIDCNLITGNYVSIEDCVIRHNVIKVALDIFSYLLDIQTIVNL